MTPGDGGSPRRAHRSWPWLTLAIVAAAAAASTVPGVAAALEYRRQEVAAGEAWRLVTGQLVHWGARMAAVDLLMLLVLGVAVELRSRRLAALALALGFAATALAVQLDGTSVERYRGISGVASALFVALGLALALDSDRVAARGAAILALSLFVAKLAIEAWSGRALFAGPLPAGVRVLPSVHLAGGVAGALAFAASRRSSRPAREGHP